MEENALSIRPTTKEDFEHVVRYFLSGSPEFLKGMGVDPQKLPPQESWIEGFLKNEGKPDQEKDRFFVTWIFQGQPIGHSSINKILYGAEAYIHLHLWRGDLRKSGLGTRLFQLSADYFIKRFGLKQLLCEPYAENIGPNKVLPRAGFSFVKRYKTTPGQIGFEQEVNQYRLKVNTLDL